MTQEDVYNTLLENDMIEVIEMPKAIYKPSPGQAIRTLKGRKQASRRNGNRPAPEKKKTGSEDNIPFQPPLQYRITWDAHQVDEQICHWESKGALKVKPEKLRWSPYSMPTNAKVMEEETRKPNTMLVPVTLRLEEKEAPADALARSLFADELPIDSPGVNQGGEEEHSRENSDLAVSGGEVEVNGTLTPTLTSHALDTLLEEPLSRRSSRRTRPDRSTTSPTPTHKRATRASNGDRKGFDPVRFTPNPAEFEENLADIMNGASESNQTPGKRGRGRRVNLKRKLGQDEREVDVHEPRQMRSAGVGRRGDEPIPKRIRVTNGRETVMRSDIGGNASAESSTSPANEDDVKFEDVGTPSLTVTSLTSRQSVPSDDTLYGAGGVDVSKERDVGDVDADADAEYEVDDADM